MPSKLFKFLRRSKLKRKACSTDALAGNPNLYNFDDSLKRSPPNPRTFSERRRACSFGEGIHTRYRNGHANGSVDDSISSGNSGSASANSLLTRRNKAKSYDVIQVTELEEDFSVPSSPIHSLLDAAVRQRQSSHLQHPFFQLDIVLREGKDLVVKDSCGTSDPYVKFKIGTKQFYKSRTVYKNLNPRWDERFTIPIEDVLKPLRISVFDYDRGISDDPMGGAELDLTSIELNTPSDIKVELKEKGKSDYMGYLLLNCTLVPKTQDDKDNYFREEDTFVFERFFFNKKGSKLGEAGKKSKSQMWNSVVTVVLVEGKNLLPMDDNGLSDPYVKFRLGNEKYKSKHKSKTLNPRWLEQFDLRLFDGQTSHLEISVWDHDVTGKDDPMGRATIDLQNLEKEVTHTLEVELEDGAGIVKLLVTISGTTDSETSSDLANFTPNPKERLDIVRKYGLANSFKQVKDVGWLQVKVFKACGLASADIGGKSDPFCVVELVNARLQTQTEYKTLNPEWAKIFTFNVKDIHSVLEISVYDEDRDKKCEFLGKIAIPLLNIKNGERRWYALKDKKLLRKVKGAIQLEMDFVYNHLKAAIRTVNPREEKFMQPEPKFKISIMKRNIDRVSKIAESFVEGGKFLQSCFDWESKARSISAFTVFLIIVSCFELYMIPVTLLIVFLQKLIVVTVVGAFAGEPSTDDYADDEDDDDDDEKEKEEKKSFKEKLQAIQEVCLQVQQGMDMVASMGERVKNTFNWTVPWLSMLAVIALSAGTLVLYFIPLRYLIMAFGINKFTKKLRAPNAIPNNELMDFLSRVPSDSELVQFRELRPDMALISGKTKKKI
ncbi:LOW QUALITY PROTEIN: multiple C2 and transmembrane domain-containing protein 1-like [Liolophura sinensis]|uniref:LOW QUALITY PROTEIN: multiple C2 and transmembrane domain-containing protein 1-like n=1 Tax=Liolophura sinensis TaxID=3198878 RepID=UPI003158C0A7